MLKFPKQITSEFTQYTSSMSKDDLKKSMENLFSGNGNNVNLSGKFTSESEFQITAESEIGPFPPYVAIYNRNSIKGLIFKNQNGKTQINILTSPNSLFQLSFFLLPLAFLIIFLNTEDDRRDIVFYLLSITVIVAIPIIILLLSGLFKTRLMNRFEKYFRLEKLD